MSHNQTTTTALTTQQDRQLAQQESIASFANDAAAAGIFADYQSRRSANTQRTQRAALVSFAEFLASVGYYPTPDNDRDRQRLIEAFGSALYTTPDRWRGISWGLVDQFKKWLVMAGYAIASVNSRLTAVKVYAALAFQADCMGELDYLKIKNVAGYSRKEAKHVNENRAQQGIDTRKGDKKAKHTRITPQQAESLKAQPDDTPQGRRDRVLMCLLIDHGLRVGEVAALTVGSVQLAANELVFYREKVNKTQRHTLTEDTAAALETYMTDLKRFTLKDTDKLLCKSASKKNPEAWKAGDLRQGGLSNRAISARVRYLGEQLGIDGLSPHDLRHFWATQAGKKVERGEASLFNLQEAGGWSSLAMPRRYVDEAAIANKNLA